MTRYKPQLVQYHDVKKPPSGNLDRVLLLLEHKEIGRFYVYGYYTNGWWFYIGGEKIDQTEKIIAWCEFPVAGEVEQ